MRQPIYSADNGALDRTNTRKSFNNGKCEQIEQPMLSAVENHFGPGRPYASTPHHYGSQTGTNLLAAPCPIVALPSTGTVAMSPNEFARPHPKTPSNRYNGGQSMRGCNGISSSSRGKYSQIDQSSPVNLAVSSQMSTVASSIGVGMPQNHKQQSSSASVMSSSSPSVSASASSLLGDVSTASMKSQQHSQSEQDAIHNSIASLYAPPKLQYSAEAVAAYQQFNYSNLYGRPASIYGAPSLYPPPPPHGLTSGRNGLHRTAYDPYVHAFGPPSSAYSPPAPARPGLSPQSPIGAITTAVSQNNTSISAKSVLSTDRTSTSSSSSSSTSVSSNPSSPSSTHMQAFTQPNDYLSPGSKLIQNAYRTSSGVKEKETHAPSNPSNEKPSSDFKVPSGKEGSLKHRILTRPYSDKEPPMKHPKMAPTSSSHSSHVKSTSSSSKTSNNNNNNNSVINNNNNGPSTKFCKGSLIELSSGELKRVEDMRAEDFVISSSKNSDLQLVDTTVVKLSPNSRYVVITFTYNNSTVDIETSPGHPFFVYGKGWASYSPDDSMEEYSLKCQRLEVGDIFISLTPRDSGSGQLKAPPKVATSVPAPPSHAQSYVSHQPQYYSQPQLKPANFTPSTGIAMCMPQNLSRKQPITYTVPTTATATAMTSRPIPPYEYQQMAYSHASHTQHFINDSALRSHYNHTAAVAAAHYRSIEDRRGPSNVSLQRTLSHDSSPRKYSLTSTMAPPPPPILQSHTGDSERGDKNGDAAIDATTRSNRKRRWSAPDAICNVDGCQLEQRKCTKH